MRSAPWLMLALALAGCGGGGAGTSPGGPEPTDTLAYLVTECRDDASGFYLGGRLEVRRADSDPVVVMQYPTIGPLPVPGVCQLFGEARYGTSSVLASPFQRLGVSPDGERVAFELTDQFSILGQDEVPPEVEGVYVARADGSGLRRLAPPSREPTFHATPDLSAPATQTPVLRFSPSGDRITYADRGPDRAGRDAVQIVTLNVETGERLQVTHLDAHPPSDDPRVFFIDSGPVFLDEETIGFVTNVEPRGLTAYAVKADGSEEPVPLPPPLTVPGSSLVPGFLVTGGARSIYALRLGPVGAAWELFASDGETLTQLTRFGRDDTGIEAVVSRDGRRVLFPASGNLGSNPNENCQLFSVDTLGGDLRQLTFFDEGQLAAGGCNYLNPRPQGCFVGIVGHDRETDTIVFESSCDPFGTNPNGDQVFAMEFDGSRMRQLTHTRGLEIAADGTVTAELPGPVTYANAP